MIVEVFGKIDCSNQRGLEALQAAVKSGLQFRPMGRGKTVVPAEARVGRRRRNRRVVYRIDEEMGARIQRMRRDGVTIRAIAKAFRLSSSGVGNYLKRQETAGGVA